MKNKTEGEGIAKFSKKVARQIALKSFGEMLDCILGYSDSGYDLTTKADEFDQNFEEDLEEMGIVVTERRIRIIESHYQKMVERLEKHIRTKYKEIYGT